MVDGCLIIQAIRDIVHRVISQDTKMALFEKMLLINEQEYLALKNARYRVGERGGEEDEYAQEIEHLWEKKVKMNIQNLMVIIVTMTMMMMTIMMIHNIHLYMNFNQPLPTSRMLHLP